MRIQNSLSLSGALLVLAASVGAPRVFAQDTISRAAAAAQNPSAEKGAATETPQAATESSAPEKPTTPAEPATPAPQPATPAEPTPVPKKAPAAAKDTKIQTEKPGYNDATPPVIADKLAVGLGMGLGGGSKSSFSQDILSYFFHVEYDVPELNLGIPGLTPFAEGRYHTFTGANADDYSHAAQVFLVGGGVHYVLPMLKGWRFSGSWDLGMLRDSKWNLVNYEFGKTKYGFASTVHVRGAWQAFDKIEVYPAAGFQFGKISRYDFEIGTLFRF